ncbi:MAG TPA: efflux RND transporter periplasmic adaptor subunit [bacterium]|nr:efflux RND transporter periplasmic adaptor subunit [bacterium]
MRIQVVIVGVVLIAVLGLTAVVRGIGHPAPTRQSVAAPDRAAVTVFATRSGDVVARVIATGTITSIRDAKLGSKLSGRVAQVLVEEGDHVAAGTPLVRLDTSDLLAQEAQAQAAVAAARAQLQKVVTGARPEERQQTADAVQQARAALASAQASVRLAQTTVDRDRTLQAQGAISQQDLDQALTQLRVAQEQAAQAQAAYDSAAQNAALVRIGARDEDLQAARAQLGQADAVLAAIDVQLRDTTIQAPFAGTITKRDVEPGQIVSPATTSTNPLLVLSQVDNVYAEFVVPAQHRFELQPGQTAALQVDGLPGQTFQGRVELVRPAADALSRTFGVRIRIANTNGALRPGMFARGVIEVGVRRNVLQIPEGAVITAAAGPMVFVVRDGRAIRRPVTLGVHHDGMVDVASGLAAGEPVVVEGQAALTDNQPVSIRGR